MVTLPRSEVRRAAPDARRSKGAGRERRRGRFGLRLGTARPAKLAGVGGGASRPPAAARRPRSLAPAGSGVLRRSRRPAPAPLAPPPRRRSRCSGSAAGSRLGGRWLAAAAGLRRRRGRALGRRAALDAPRWPRGLHRPGGGPRQRCSRRRLRPFAASSSSSPRSALSARAPCHHPARTRRRLLPRSPPRSRCPARGGRASRGQRPR